jgi:hypothetical protein
MPCFRWQVVCGILLLSLGLGHSAGALEPRVAIAPIAPGKTAPVALQRVFAEELPNALAQVGFLLRPPNEVDMKVGERPALLRCTAGPCLSEEADFLQVDRLVLARLERTGDREGGLTVGLVLYDAIEKRPIAEAIERCGPCTAEVLRGVVLGAATRLYREVLPAVGNSPPPPVTAPVPVAPLPRFHALKWVMLATGLATAAVGGGVWGVNGAGTCSLVPPQLECPQVFDTVALGAALVGVGAALAASSVLLFVLDRQTPPRAAVGLLPGRAGATLMMEGRF